MAPAVPCEYPISKHPSARALSACSAGREAVGAPVGDADGERRAPAEPTPNDGQEVAEVLTGYSRGTSTDTRGYSRGARTGTRGDSGRGSNGYSRGTLTQGHPRRVPIREPPRVPSRVPIREPPRVPVGVPPRVPSRYPSSGGTGPLFCLDAASPSGPCAAPREHAVALAAARVAAVRAPLSRLASVVCSPPRFLALVYVYLPPCRSAPFGFRA